MKTNENINIEEESIRVPLDMVPDVFSIIVSQRLGHELTQASASNWHFTMTVQYNRTDAIQKKAVNDILRILESFNEYRNATHNELNWR